MSPGTPWKVARQLRAPDDTKAQLLPPLTEVLKANYPDGRFQGAVFASETQGDYLTWAFFPNITVTSYSHLHLFPVNYWQENTATYLGQPGWWDVLRRRHANLVVLEAEIYPDLCQHLREDPGWQVVSDEAGDGRKASLYCRLFIAVRKHPV